KFDPQSITEEYAQLCRQYRVRTVVGDNYARDWVAGAWRKLGFEYIRAASQKVRFTLRLYPCSPVAWRGCPITRASFGSFACLSGARIGVARIRSSIRATVTTTSQTSCAVCSLFSRRRLSSSRRRSWHRSPWAVHHTMSLVAFSSPPTRSWRRRSPPCRRNSQRSLCPPPPLLHP